MNALDRRAEPLSWLCLVLGSAAMLFVGWRLNAPVAAWLVPIFLIRFFRDRRHWYSTLPAIPFLAVASFIQLYGVWDVEAWMVPVFSLLRAGAFLVALYVDRALSRRLPPGAGTLVYPSVYTSPMPPPEPWPTGAGRLMA